MMLSLGGGEPRYAPIESSALRAMMQSGKPLAAARLPLTRERAWDLVCPWSLIQLANEPRLLEGYLVNAAHHYAN